MGHELHNTPLWNPGVATLTRPLHALLGLLGLIWLVGGLRVYRWFFWAWIVTAVPMIAVDPSQEWTLQLIRLDVHQGSYSSVSFSGGPSIYTNYQTRGINFAPLLVGLWFGWLTRRGVFPLFKSPPGSRERLNAQRLARWLQLGIVAGVGGFLAWCGWLRTAPMVVVAAEPGLSFYYKDERLGSGYLRVTPALLEKMGLDGGVPPEQWTLRGGSHHPWAEGIFIDDGTSRAGIHVAKENPGPNDLQIETPWGLRVATIRLASNNERRWLNPYIAKTNAEFDVQVELPSPVVQGGAHFPVKVRVDALVDVPEFAQLRIRPIFLPFETAQGEFPSRPRSERAVAVPSDSDLLALSEQSTVEAVVQVPAPFRPGRYALQLSGSFEDAQGRPLQERPTHWGYSHYGLVTVEAAKALDSLSHGAVDALELSTPEIAQ
ncbi:MAG: hypothetical protein ACFB20_06980 [Opitutales bacterium]